MRTFDLDKIRQGIGTYSEAITGLNLKEWVENLANIALVNSLGDIALFERQYRLPNSVCGHYFFYSRGRQAKEAAEAFLTELFTGDYDVEIVTGLTPIEHKAAMWMTRKLGFSFHGEISTDAGVCILALLTKHEWLQLRGIN